MPQDRQAMAESIKQEILMELNNKPMSNTHDNHYTNPEDQHAGEPAKAEGAERAKMKEMEVSRQVMEDYGQHRPRAGENTQMPGWNQVFGGNRPSRADLERIKREILVDLHRDMHREMEEQYAYPYPEPEYKVQRPLSHYDRTVAESVKRDLLDDLEARRAARYAEMYGYGHLVSDRNLNQMIKHRYGTLRDIKGDLKKELEALRDIENRIVSIQDPQVRELAHSIVMEARRQGLTLDEVLNRVNQQEGINKSGWRQQISNMWNHGNGKSFLFGAGAAVLVGMLLPAARRNLHEVAVRTVEEGMDLVDKTKNVFNWGQDDGDPAQGNSMDPLLDPIIDSAVEPAVDAVVDRVMEGGPGQCRGHLADDQTGIDINKPDH